MAPLLHRVAIKMRHLGTIVQLCRTISLQLRHVSTIGKNLLNSNTSSTRSHNVTNFGPLTAEIGLGVWGTPANFNRFLVLASLLQRRRSPEANQTLHMLGRLLGCYTYIHFRRILPSNEILPVAKFISRPSFALSNIGA